MEFYGNVTYMTTKHSNVTLHFTLMRDFKFLAVKLLDFFTGGYDAVSLGK
jgi:hypothetical protein